jgi:MFS family permease
VFGLFTSLAPGFVSATLHHDSRLLAGVVSFIAFGGATLAQMTTGRLADRTRMLAGILAQAVGLVVVAVAMEDANLAAFLIGGGLAGAGAGVVFKSALAAYLGGAEPARRGEAASSLFFLAYLGLIIPVLGIGISTQFVSSQTGRTPDRPGGTPEGSRNAIRWALELAVVLRTFTPLRLALECAPWSRLEV